MRCFMATPWDVSRVVVDILRLLGTSERRRRNRVFGLIGDFTPGFVTALIAEKLPLPPLLTLPRSLSPLTSLDKDATT